MVADVPDYNTFVSVQCVSADLFYHLTSPPPALSWNNFADPRILAPQSFNDFSFFGHFKQGLYCADVLYVAPDMDSLAFIGVLSVPFFNLFKLGVGGQLGNSRKVREVVRQKSGYFHSPLFDF